MTDSDIERLSKEVMNLIENKTLDPDVERRVNDIQNEIQKDLDEIREHGAKRDFFLERMDTKLREYRSEESDYDQKPCTCPSPNCPLKDGQIPAIIDMSKGFNRGMAEFRQTHRGQPQILDDARDAWREKKRRVKNELRRIIRIIHANETEEGDNRFVET